MQSVTTIGFDIAKDAPTINAVLAGQPRISDMWKLSTRLITFILFVSALLNSTLAVSAENDLQKLLRQHQEAMAAGKYPAALDYARRWRSIIVSRMGNSTIASATGDDMMARAYLSQGDYKQSEVLSKQAIKVFERVNGRNNPKHAEIYGNLRVDLPSTGTLHRGSQYLPHAARYQRKIP